MTLADFNIGQIYATGPGFGLIGTKIDHEHILECVTGEVKYVPSCRGGSPLTLEVLKALKKQLEWHELITLNHKRFPLKW